jgi:hypothetical protein
LAPAAFAEHPAHSRHLLARPSQENLAATGIALPAEAIARLDGIAADSKAA